MEETLNKTGRSREALWYALGAISSAKSDYDKALEYYNKSLSGPIYELASYFAIGKIYIAQGDYEKAQGVFEDILQNYYIDYTLLATLITQAHYYKGLACENLGQTEQATDAYRDFLNLWGDSEYQLEIIKDARIRLSKLTA